MDRNCLINFWTTPGHGCIGQQLSGVAFIVITHAGNPFNAERSWHRCFGFTSARLS